MAAHLFRQYEALEEKGVGKVMDRGRRRALAKFVGVLGALAFVLLLTSVTSSPADRAATTSGHSGTVLDAYGDLPLSFEANRGQTDEQVKFLSRGNGYNLFLTATEAVLALSKPTAATSADAEESQAIEPAVLRMQLVGANPKPQIVGLEKLPGEVNYFLGNDPRQWRTDIPTYAKVQYQGVYPGVDLVYYGDQRQLEYDFIVAPGADPSTITLGFEGADTLEVDPQGDLVLHIASGEVRQHKPVVYQEVDGVRQEIAGGYMLKDTHQVGFQVGAYDTAMPLVIDPVLVYSTFLGGGGTDRGFGIVVDAAGNAYLAVRTESTDFPTAGSPYQSANAGNADISVTKLNSSGSGLVYSTYLGGSGNDGNCCLQLTIDSSGNAYLTGDTTSTDFPTTLGAFQPIFAGGGGAADDAFVTKLNSMGSALLYSTYLGGSDDDGAGDIAVDSSGNAYVTGATRSSNFPTTLGAYQPVFGGGGVDSFVVKMNSTGTALVYSTYLGRSSPESGSGIAVDSAGNAYATGITLSTNFPTTSGAFQTAHGGGLVDVYVTKLNSSGSALVYSTFLGGSGQDHAAGIAVDSAGSAYLTGYTFSTDFPTQNPLQATHGGGGSDARDTYMTKLHSSGSALVYSTYLGGNGFDAGVGIAVDDDGSAHVIGSTSSTNFPTTPGAIQTAFGGGVDDVFVTKVNFSGTALLYSTYLGGSGQDEGTRIAVDSAGSAYVTGGTTSTNFPTTSGAFQTAFGGTQDAFVAKITEIVQVAIDIKPGSDPNSINCNNEEGVIPVAILTTNDFDATTVDHTTVTFEGASETHVNNETGEPKRHEEDVDGDGDIDLVFHFRLGDTDLTCDSTEGTLTGETFDGVPIEGTDSVRMVEGGGG